MDVGSISNNALDIQSILLNGANDLNRKSNGNNVLNQTAEYAKKGEPMYMADMDSDDDGVVTLDEFREYCKDKGISTRDMVKMSQMATSYRTMMAEEETINYISKLIPNTSPKVKEANSNNSKQNNNLNNANSNTISYKDYMEYCEQNTLHNELKINAKVEETDDGSFKVSTSGKAIDSYSNTENSIVKSMYEEVV